MSTVLLDSAVSALGPLVRDVVFVGGASIHLWLTDPAAPPVRATDDVDVICDVATLSKYYRFAERLRERGFSEAVGEPVICRWRHESAGVTLDVMPADSNVLGFSNPWYATALESAVVVDLNSGTQIRAAAPPVVVATKLAAWKGRGGDDVLSSHDVHDIVVLIDGRPELGSEMLAQPSALKAYVANELAALNQNRYFDYVVESALQGYGRLAAERSAVVERRVMALIEGRDETAEDKG